MRRKIVSIGIVVAVAASLGLSACSDSDPEAADTPATAETIVNSATQTDANGETIPPEAESVESEVVSSEEAGGGGGGDVVGDVAAGETFFAATCSGCHLDNGKSAGGVGPQLQGDPNIVDQQFVIDTVTNGKGAMPAGLASGADLENVSAYVVSLQ